MWFIFEKYFFKHNCLVFLILTDADVYYYSYFSHLNIQHRNLYTDTLIGFLFINIVLYQQYKTRSKRFTLILSCMMAEEYHTL
jgi:hypothetical protein